MPNEKQPFAIQKHYMTPMTWLQVAKIVEGMKAQKRGFWKFQRDAYEVSVGNKRFTLKKIRYAKNERHYPIIEGVVVSEPPLLLKINITPNYWWFCFYLLFPLCFIPFSLLQEIKINGVYRAPELWERFLIVCVGGGMPLTMCWFNLIRPVRQTEQWLMDKLSLRECAPKPLGS